MLFTSHSPRSVQPFWRDWETNIHTNFPTCFFTWTVWTKLMWTTLNSQIRKKKTIYNNTHSSQIILDNIRIVDWLRFQHASSHRKYCEWVIGYTLYVGRTRRPAAPATDGWWQIIWRTMNTCTYWLKCNFISSTYANMFLNVIGRTLSPRVKRNAMIDYSVRDNTISD